MGVGLQGNYQVGLGQGDAQQPAARGFTGLQGCFQGSSGLAGYHPVGHIDCNNWAGLQGFGGCDRHLFGHVAINQQPAMPGHRRKMLGTALLAAKASATGPARSITASPVVRSQA